MLGLAAYELGARFEGLDLARDPEWPDLILADYPEAEVFEQALRRPSPAEPAPPGGFAPEQAPEAYEAAVADVVRRIGEGELFQANIAQGWSGVLDASDDPFAAFRRLVGRSPAPLSAYWRLPGLVLVSHSPERFLSVEAGRGRSGAVKGPRPRAPGPGAGAAADPAEDAALAAELADSAKDRAENLMIVDLMRNDLSRVCEPGSVEVTALNVVEGFPNVWHLVSTVEGDMAEGRDLADLIAASFPPGSITGAPKHQAMQVISELEPAPRGPWCGSLFRIDGSGAMDSSVLIRTAAFVQHGSAWRWRALAGAGITADSDPLAERLETEAKISGLRQALAPASSGVTS